MPPRRALNESLERLRSELEDSESLSAKERERLESLLDDVLARADGGDDEHPLSLTDRLREATEQLEESHPKLTHAIGAVAEALSRLGI